MVVTTVAGIFDFTLSVIEKVPVPLSASVKVIFITYEPFRASVVLPEITLKLPPSKFVNKDAVPS